MRWFLCIFLIAIASIFVVRLVHDDNLSERVITEGIPDVSMGVTGERVKESVESKWIYRRHILDRKFKTHERYLVDRRQAIHGVKIVRLTRLRRGIRSYVVQVDIASKDEERVARLSNPFGFSTTAIWRGDRQIASLFSMRRTLTMGIWCESLEEADQLMDDFMNEAIDEEPVHVEFPGFER